MYFEDRKAENFQHSNFRRQEIQLLHCIGVWFADKIPDSTSTPQCFHFINCLSASSMLTRRENRMQESEKQNQGSLSLMVATSVAWRILFCGLHFWSLLSFSLAYNPISFRSIWCQFLESLL